jgi:prenyltransferase beta subunit
MNRVAAMAATALGAAKGSVVSFLSSRLDPAGGFLGRDGRPDIYYTSFALDSLSALALSAGRPDGCASSGGPASVPAAGDPASLLPDLRPTGSWVSAFGAGQTLDFVHRTCLARCWTRLPGVDASRAMRKQLAASLEQCRAPDGGYGTVPSPATGSVTGTFFALGAYDDLGLLPPSPLKALSALDRLATPDGAFANEPGTSQGTTLATAGLAILNAALRRRTDSRVIPWLMARCHCEGGFLASPDAPLPDLLSTATALYAFHVTGTTLDRARVATCLGFIESLQEPSGGFCGQWVDDTADTEYTFYALLSLGCLVAMEEGCRT